MIGMSPSRHLSSASAYAAAGIASILVLAGCTAAPADSRTSPSASAPATATGGTTAGGGSASSSAPALASVSDDEIRKAFTDGAKEMQVPGAVLVLKRPGHPDLTLAYGTRERNGTTPVTVNDHERVGSITKTWTGTAILQLVQEGKLALGDPVSKFRPDVPNGANITIEQLLEMRSGLYNYTFDVAWNMITDEQPQRVWTPEEALRIAFGHPAVFAPGADFQYSNTNTVLLGLIAEKLDGKPLRQIFQDRIFTPLGLTQTSMPAPESSALPEPYARGYMFGTNASTIESSKLPDDQLAQARSGLLAPHDETNVNPSWAYAAGAGVSTAPELATLAEALVNGKLLNTDLQAKRLASIKPLSPSSGYGMNLAQFGPMYGHTGELPGYNSFAAYDPAAKVTLVTWANLAPLPDGRAPATELAKTVIGMVYGSTGS